MTPDFRRHLQQQLDQISARGLFKDERILTSAQGSHVSVKDGREVINLCANNYLGLAGHPEVVEAARQGLSQWGYGLSSVRFICGTQSIHKQLENELSHFLHSEDTILYPSCFDANGGLFETLLGAEDAVISDALNHASIIDGVRLCKAQRYRYANNDMDELETQLKAADDAGARFKLITSDGVFSMDGSIAKLERICELAEAYNAQVHVDDSHAVGVIGDGGRGSPAYRDCIERVDITTGTLGKALGGAGGGYTSGRKEIVALLRQRSRPYLFSNTLSPAVVAGSLKALELLQQSGQLLHKLQANAKLFRDGMQQLGFDLIPGEHPIIPIMLYDAATAVEFADRMLQKGVYVIAFSFPVVPQGQARIRTQISAAHSEQDLRFAMRCFGEVKVEMGI